MMKINKNKIVLLFIFLISVLVSCTENQTEYMFDEPVNKRFETLKKEYVDVLTQPEDGWIGYYAPNAKVGGFVILMKFDDAGNVTMASDYNQGTNDNTTTYRIDKRLKIELVFESHGILQQIYETDNNSVEGEYVFYIKEVKEDEIILESATDFGYDGSGITELKLHKASAEHWNFESVYETTPKLANGYNTEKYFRSIYVEGTDVKKSFSYVDGYSNSEINRYAIIKSLENEEIKEETVSIAVTHDGLKFLTPYTINGKEVANFVYDEENNRFVSEDGGQTTIIEHTTEPAVLHYPSVNIGEDGEFYSQQHFPIWLVPSIKKTSSEKFNTAIASAGVRRFFIEYNTDAEGNFPQKYEAMIFIEYYKGTGWFAKKKWATILCKVERIKNERIIFKPLTKLEDMVADTNYQIKLQPIYDILTNKDGFYVEEQPQTSLYGDKPGFLFISKENPQLRFSTVVI